jgi:hypothetical protein
MGDDEVRRWRRVSGPGLEIELEMAMWIVASKESFILYISLYGVCQYPHTFRTLLSFSAGCARHGVLFFLSELDLTHPHYYY